MEKPKALLQKPVRTNLLQNCTESHGSVHVAPQGLQLLVAEALVQLVHGVDKLRELHVVVQVLGTTRILSALSKLNPPEKNKNKQTQERSLEVSVLPEAQTLLQHPHNAPEPSSSQQDGRGLSH